MKNFVLVLSFHLVLFIGGCAKVESETTSEEALSELEGSGLQTVIRSQRCMLKKGNHKWRQRKTSF